MTDLYSSPKHPLKSKTIWVNFFMAAAAFFPPVQVFIAANPEAVGLAVAGINWVLRFVTKDRLSLQES